MKDHWRLALKCAGGILALAIPVGAILYYIYGGPSLASFAYGVVAGVLSYVSMAATVSLLTGRSVELLLAVGAFSFMGRLILAAAVLGVPVYLDLWPALPMFGAFAGVYLMENALLMLMMPRAISSGAESEVRPARDEEDRRAKAS